MRAKQNSLKGKVALVAPVRPKAWAIALVTLLAVALGGASSVMAAPPLYQCPGQPPGPAAPTANYDCPGGGKVVNGKFVAADAGGDKPQAEQPPPVLCNTYEKWDDGAQKCVPGADVGKTSDCGGVKTAINFGCKDNGNAIISLLFAIVRFLSAGIGIVMIASVVVAGIQYSAARGDPSATAGAVKRLASTAAALLLYIFGYALLNFIIPGGFFK
jgi:hypothetical protein